jgi:hypothetical protein
MKPHGVVDAGQCKVTLTPAQYRKRFGALGTQLRRAAQPVG